MKQIINRKVYDTEEAEKIAEFTLDTYPELQEEQTEVLYKTDSGDYFLYVEWFSDTFYGEKHVLKDPFEEKIRLLTEEEAIDWAERRSIEAEIILDEFGDHIESA